MELSDFAKQELRKRYHTLLLKSGERLNDVKCFSEYLLKNTTWASAPSSKRGEISLIEHSVLVSEYLFKISSAFSLSVPDSSLVICGLFHDVSKLGGFVDGKFCPRFLKKGDSWVYNMRLPEISLSCRSLYTISRFIPLSEPEIQAILGVDEVGIQSTYLRYKETSLTLILRWCDYFVSHVVEKSGRFEYSYIPWFV